MDHVLTAGIVALPAIGAVLAFAGGPDRAAARSITMAWATVVVAAFTAIVVAVSGPIGEQGRPAPLALFADGFAVLVVTSGALINATVQMYGRRYLFDDDRRLRFFVLVSVLGSATAATVLAATLWTLLLSWVATSIATCALLAHRPELAEARAGVARTARTFAIGDAALLAAVLLATATVGTVDLRRETDAAASLADESWSLFGLTIDALAIVAVLVTVAALARSALLPMPQWLTGTLAAPTPVSALLHAGIVNAGGILLIRLGSLFTGSTFAVYAAATAGLATMAVGWWSMRTRADVKGELVHSTTAQMGFMVVQCAIGAFGAGTFHIVAHAWFKVWLFLGAGGAIGRQAQQRRWLPPDAAFGSVARGALALLVGVGSVVSAVAAFDPPVLEHRGGAVVAAFTALFAVCATWGLLGRSGARATDAITGSALVAASVWAYLALASLVDRLVVGVELDDGAFASTRFVLALTALALAGLALARGLARRAPVKEAA